MSTDGAIRKYIRCRMIGATVKEKELPPCPEHPTPIEKLAGGKCAKCGWLVNRHLTEEEANNV